MRAKYLLFPAAALLCGAALAQNPTKNIIKTTFEDGDGGWITFGGEGKVSVTGDAKEVKEGKAALKFEYPVAKGKAAFLARPVPDGGLAGMNSLRFWIKSDYTTPIIVSLQEREGGRWNAAFTAPDNAWQNVELTTADFDPSDGPDDPKDPNGKLDLEKVEGIGLVDVGQIFIQFENEFVTKVLGVKPGQHTLFLDDFLASEEALPGGPEAADPVRIDTFRRPQTAWAGLFGARVATVEAKPLNARGLQAQYRQAPDAYPGAVRSVKRGSLTGTSKLAFDAASVRPAELTVQLEEVSGGKYNIQISVEGGSTAKAREAAFADFKPADDSKDNNGKLDLDQVKQILILDVAGPINQVDQENTLWLTNLRAVK